MGKIREIQVWITESKRKLEKRVGLIKSTREMMVMKREAKSSEQKVRRPKV